MVGESFGCIIAPSSRSHRRKIVPNYWKMTLLLPFLSFWLPENKCPAGNCVKAGKKKALIKGWVWEILTFNENHNSDINLGQTFSDP